MIVDDEPLALTGIVVTEVLQSLKRDVTQIARYLSLWDMLEPAGLSTYREAAAIFRQARSRGVNVTTIDAIISSIALEHGATIFTLDKDFSRIARFTPLRLDLSQAFGMSPKSKPIHMRSHQTRGASIELRGLNR